MVHFDKLDLNFIKLLGPHPFPRLGLSTVGFTYNFISVWTDSVYALLRRMKSFHSNTLITMMPTSLNCPLFRPSGSFRWFWHVPLHHRWKSKPIPVVNYRCRLADNVRNSIGDHGATWFALYTTVKITRKIPVSGLRHF